MRIPPSFPLWRLVSGSLVSTKPVVIGATGDVELTTDGLGGLLVNEAAVGGGSTSAATESAAGIVELATVAEVQTGTDTERCVTPAGASATYALIGRGINTTPLAAAPGSPTKGDIVCADRVTWDPAGFGAGGAYLVWYLGAVGGWGPLTAQLDA